MLIVAAFGRAALFLLALFGLCYWIHRLTETDVHFAPVCALCVMGVVTYAGGIVGALAPATWGGGCGGRHRRCSGNALSPWSWSC